MASRRAKGEGTVFRTPEGWKARITVEGKKIERRGKTRREAAEKRDRAVNEFLAPRSETPKFLDYVQDLLANHFPHNVTRSTLELYLSFAGNHLVGSELAKLRLDEAKTADVQKFVDKLAGEMAPSSVRRIGSFVCRAFQIATDGELISRNPALRVTYPRIPATGRSVLTGQDSRRLLEAQMSPRMRAMITVALSTGLRRGELCGLRWEQVDLEAGILTVETQIVRHQGGIEETALKTPASQRDVPLTPDAIDAIKAQPKLGPYVFSTDSGKPIRPDTFTRDWVRVAKRLGFEGVRLHDLRASFISILLQNGADVRTVQELAGHTSSAITQEVYARSHREAKQDAIGKLGKALGNSKNSEDKVPDKVPLEDVDEG